jgi:TonB-dependent starch-binding outer membrane protein SusC
MQFRADLMSRVDIKINNNTKGMAKSLLKVFCVSLLLVFSGQVFAQTITVRGVVVSQEDEEPMIGVNIMIKDTPDGTVTGFDGDFELEVPSDAILLFSFIGYQDQEIPVGGRTNFEITMVRDAHILEGVVVTGYKTVVKSDIAGAISSVKVKDIEKLPVLGFDQALQGQISGLQVTQATGAPGDDIAIRIRGAGTLGNNNPLYIIDGVPTTGNINMFSTTDIESIEVLKDGSAAAIYGARAANGVIVITTKKGQTGAPKFSVQSYYGFQESNRLPKLLNAQEYLMIRNEAIGNANELRDPIRQIPLYDPAILDTLPDMDWLGEVFRIAPIQKHTISASGGGDNGNYYIMGEYFNQEGVFKGQGFEKYLLRFNGETMGKWLKIGNNISLSFSNRDVIGSSGDGAGPGNELSGIRYSLIAAPVFKNRYDDGSFVTTSAFLGDPILYGDGNANPSAFIEATDWNIKRYRIFGNVFAEFKIFKDLKFRTNLGMDLVFRQEKIFKSRLSAAIYDPTSLSEGTVIDRNLVWNNMFDYNKTFGDQDAHNLSVFVGMEVIDNRTDYLGASARNFFSTNPNFRFIDNSVTTDLKDIGTSGIASEWGLLSYFAQAGYSYKRKYVINASVRRDGSSRFGAANRYGVFPSFALAWNLANEPFFDDLPIFSSLKLRGSWGQLGNQEIGTYPFSSLVETGLFVYPFGGNIVTGAQVLETGNENIKWETTTQTDVGLEFSLLDDKLSVMADYYVKNTEDILVRVPLPQSAGAFNPPFVNAGEVQNKGFELAVNWKDFTGAFSYEINANISTVSNEVIALADDEPILGGFGLSDGPITRTEPGYPLGSFYVYQMEGIFQTQEEIEASPFQTDETRPGDIRFADLNGDGIIDDKDRAHLGNPFPNFIYGITANLTYKNFDLSMLLQGVQGNDVYFLYGGFAYEVQSRGFNSYSEILNRWTPDNTDTNIPKVSIDDRNGNRRISTRFLEDGSYFRMRNITLGYDFGALLNTQALTGLRAYVSVQNAFTITSYSGLDPEIQANTNDTQGFNVSSDLAVGIDWGTVPAPRTVIFGLNLNF